MADTTTANSKNLYKDNTELYGKKIAPKEVPSTEIGIDIDDSFYETIASTGDSSVVDINKINAFTQITNSRETLYDVLDTMSRDSTIAAVLETYAEDATEPNEQGDIVWAEASNDKILKYISFLLDSLNVNKYIYQWIYSLCKYGDVYLKLFRQSDFEDALLKNVDEESRLLNEKFEASQEPYNVLADKEKLEVSDEELEKGLDDAAKQYQMSREDFEKEIKDKELFKYDLLMKKAMKVVTE